MVRPDPPVQAPSNATQTQQQQQQQQAQQQQQQKELGHGCIIAGGLLWIADVAIAVSGQEELLPWSLSLTFHQNAGCALLTW